MVGKVDNETYRIYAKAWDALFILPVVMVLLAVGERSFFGLQNWWLSVWSNANAAQVRGRTVIHKCRTGNCML